MNLTLTPARIDQEDTWKADGESSRSTYKVAGLEALGISWCHLRQSMALDSNGKRLWLTYLCTANEADEVIDFVYHWVFKDAEIGPITLVRLLRFFYSAKLREVEASNAF